MQNTVSSGMSRLRQHTSVWLAQLVKSMAAPTHVHTCVQEVRDQSPDQTIPTQDSIPSGLGKMISSQYVWASATEDCGVKAHGSTLVTRGYHLILIRVDNYVDGGSIFSNGRPLPQQAFPCPRILPALISGRTMYSVSTNFENTQRVSFRSASEILELGLSN